MLRIELDERLAYCDVVAFLNVDVLNSALDLARKVHKLNRAHLAGRRNGRAKLRATLDGNVTSARRSWFVDAPRADMHIAPAGRPAVDAGVPIADAGEDFDRAVRPAGRTPDAGAFEAPASGLVRTARREP